MMTGPAELSMPAKGKKAGKDKTRGRRKDSRQTEAETRKARASEKRVRARDFEERQARLELEGEPGFAESLMGDGGSAS